MFSRGPAARRPNSPGCPPASGSADIHIRGVLDVLGGRMPRAKDAVDIGKDGQRAGLAGGG
eukprot:5206783-Pyramimonas_sp.AAC.1